MMQSIMQPVMAPIMRGVMGASRGGRYNGPSLALRFGENQYLMGAIGKKPDAYQPEGLITFARSTAAWEWDWQGNYSEVAAGVMRIAHDPLTKATSATPQTLGTGSYTFAVTYQYAIGAAVRVSADANNWMVGRVTASTVNSVTIWVSGTPVGAGTYSAWTLIVRRGIRVEEQRANLLLQSGNPALAPWTNESVTLGPPAAGPLGNETPVYETAVSGFFRVRQQASSVVAGVAYTYKFNIKKLGRRYLFIRTQARTLANENIGFDLDTLTTTFVPAGWTASIRIVSPGIYQLTATCTALTTNGVVHGVLASNAPITTNTLQNYVGDPAQGFVYVSGQFEAGASPSSDIPTGASQVIRAADVPNVNTLAPWFNPLEGLLVARVIRESISPSQTLVALSGTSISTISLESGPGNPAQLRMRVSVDGVQVAIPVAANSSAAYTPIKMAAAYKKDFFSVSANGAPPAEDTSGTVPVVTRLEIGSVNNVAHLNGIIEDITYHPRVKDAQQAAA